MSEERNQHIAAENREKEQNKRMQRQIRDMKEEMADVSKKEAEASRKKHESVGAGRYEIIWLYSEPKRKWLLYDPFTRKWTLRA